MDISSRKLTSNVIWKFGERIAAQLVTFVVSIVLGRLLAPEDYGAVAMVITFITVANILVTEGIPSALIQKKEATNQDFSSVFFFNLAISLLAYLILFFCAPFIASYFRLPILKPVVRVLGLQVIISAVKCMQYCFVARNLIFKKFFWATFSGTLISGVLGIWFAYDGYGVWALVIQYLSNSLIDTIVLWFVVKWRPTLFFSFKRIKGMLSFGWKMLVESLCNTIAGEIRSIVIGRVYTASDLAFYNRGFQFPRLLIVNFTSSISSVLFPAISSVQDDQERVIVLLRKTIRVTSYLSFPALTGLALVSPRLISILLTDKWSGAVPFMQIACFTYALQVGMIPRHQALNGTGRSDVFLIENTIARIVSLTILFIVYRKGVFTIAMSGIISGVLLAGIVVFTSYRYNHYSVKDQFLDVIPTIIGCVVVGFTVWMLDRLHGSSIVILCLQVVSGITVFLLYSQILKLEEYEFCKKYVLRITRRTANGGLE